MTDEYNQSGIGCQWGPGAEHTAVGGGELGGPGWLYAFTHPLIAEFLSSFLPYHEGRRLWEADGDIGLTGSGIEVGCTRLVTVRRIPLPVTTPAQHVEFATLVVKAVGAQGIWQDLVDDTLAEAALYMTGGCPEWAKAAAAEVVGWAVQGTTDVGLVALAEQARRCSCASTPSQHRK